MPKTAKVTPAVLKERQLIGAEIKRRRKAKPWSQQELADRSGTDAGNISRIERGKQGVLDPLLEAITGALGATLAELRRPTTMPAEGGNVPPREARLLLARELLDLLPDDAIEPFLKWAREAIKAGQAAPKKRADEG